MYTSCDCDYRMGVLLQGRHRNRGVTVLRADIDQLDKLSKTLTTIGGEIDGIKVNDKVNDVVGAMPGSSVPAACVQTSTHVEGAFLRIGERMKDLAVRITACTQNLQMTDDQFAQKMHELDFHK